MSEKKLVICQKWEESERGWGSRPDGYSLHLNEASRTDFCNDYWKRMPSSAPDEYSREDGSLYWCMVEQEVFEQIQNSKNGVRFWGESPLGIDGLQGPDGWRSCG